MKSDFELGLVAAGFTVVAATFTPPTIEGCEFEALVWDPAKEKPALGYGTTRKEAVEKAHGLLLAKRPSLFVSG